MISTTWTDALAGKPAAGPDVCSDVRLRAERRAPEAFTAPYQGTGLPFGASVVDMVPDAVAPAGSPHSTDNVHNGTPITTLGLHSSRRPPG